MKKTILSIIVLCMCTTLGVQAQIKAGNWYNGWLCYTAEEEPNGVIMMNAMAEGEEHEFVLVPVAGKTDTYRVTDGHNDYVNEYSDIATVCHQKGSGLDVFCFYDGKNQLKAVMSNERDWDAEQVSRKRWLGQFYANYTSVENNLKVVWDAYNITVDGHQANYKVETFNGLVTGFVTITPVEGGTNFLEGTWEVEPTLQGMVLHGAVFNPEENWWVRNGVHIALEKTPSEYGRFSFASTMLLNTQTLRRYDKKTLRIMRNEIMARHGYRFQSKDLQEYFGKQSWYKPVASNNQVKLSFVEQLNVELIKYTENSK